MYTQGSVFLENFLLFKVLERLNVFLHMTVKKLS